MENSSGLQFPGLRRWGLIGLLLWAGAPASLLGHVALFPQRAAAGARHESFFIRAPVEKDIPAVELGFEVDPEWLDNGGELTFEAVPEWDLHLEFDEQDRISKVYWTTEGEGAPPHTFQMIFMRVNVPKVPGVYPFVAWQKYTDGSVVWWNEPRGEETQNPFPTVTVEPEPWLGVGLFQFSTAAAAALALLISLYSVSLAKRRAAGSSNPDFK